jgi:hypothetical protein
VITTAEKKKALSPARTASDNSVSRTLVLTLPQITVARIWLEFLAQFKHARGIGVAGIGLELQAQLTKAEDRQRKAGEQCGLDDAGNDAQPDPYGGNGRHGLVPEL